MSRRDGKLNFREYLLPSWLFMSMAFYLSEKEAGVERQRGLHARCFRQRIHVDEKALVSLCPLVVFLFDWKKIEKLNNFKESSIKKEKERKNEKGIDPKIL